MNRHIGLKATPEGEKLVLSSELEQNCQVVYKKTEDEKGYAFHELWNEQLDVAYDENYVIVPIRSVYNGTFGYTKDDVFANIIGSRDDPCPPPDRGYGRSWKELLTSKGIDCRQCVMDGTFYDSKDQSGQTYFTNCACNTTVIGGHVINGINATTMKKGSDVLLLPICSHHNSYCTDDSRRNGAGFYMMPKKSGKGIKLKNYFPSDR